MTLICGWCQLLSVVLVVTAVHVSAVCDGQPVIMIVKLW